MLVARPPVWYIHDCPQSQLQIPKMRWAAFCTHIHPATVIAVHTSLNTIYNLVTIAYLHTSQSGLNCRLAQIISSSQPRLQSGLMSEIESTPHLIHVLESISQHLPVDSRFIRAVSWLNFRPSAAEGLEHQ